MLGWWTLDVNFCHERMCPANFFFFFFGVLPKEGLMINCCMKPSFGVTYQIGLVEQLLVNPWYDNKKDLNGLFQCDTAHVNFCLCFSPMHCMSISATKSQRRSSGSSVQQSMHRIGLEYPETDKSIPHLPRFLTFKCQMLRKECAESCSE